MRWYFADRTRTDDLFSDSARESRLKAPGNDCFNAIAYGISSTSQKTELSPIVTPVDPTEQRCITSEIEGRRFTSGDIERTRNQEFAMPVR